MLLSTVAILAGTLAASLAHQGASGDVTSLVERVRDPEVRAGFAAAVQKNLIPAATENAYPGFFNISADGGAYGGDATWPGLDSWQMAGAYLLLGRTRLVTDYFDFVRASQRKDGNIPFAIFTGDTQPGTTYLRGMKSPEDIFTYRPPVREDAPASSRQTRQWIGLFLHWEIESKALNTLGPVCYLLTASEIVQATKDKEWLAPRLASIEAAGKYLVSQISPNGLMSGSGFYTELPARWGWDGVTQCYAIHAFRELAKVEAFAGRNDEAKAWSRRADDLTKAFRKAFWVGNHFGEYIHITHGLVDSHGLSDTNWAAIAFGIATSRQANLLWPTLTGESKFWWGGMPTQTVTKPDAYEEWEHEKVPFQTPSATNDVAAMGRSWYLEALACKRMHADVRLIESARRVSQAAKDGYWRERYHPKPDGTVSADGAEKYCEYAAVLARVVLENPKLFLTRRSSRQGGE